MHAKQFKHVYLPSVAKLKILLEIAQNLKPILPQDLHQNKLLHSKTKEMRI